MVTVTYCTVCNCINQVFMVVLIKLYFESLTVYSIFIIASSAVEPCTYRPDDKVVQRVSHCEV